MMIGMTKVKIAVSLPAELVEQAKRAVAEGRAASVSAYVAEALAEKSSEEDFDALLDQMLEETGGPATPEEIAWVERTFRR
jgi:antitoxin ParD1/3/4